VRPARRDMGRDMVAARPILARGGPRGTVRPGGEGGGIALGWLERHLGWRDDGSDRPPGEALPFPRRFTETAPMTGARCFPL